MAMFTTRTNRVNYLLVFKLKLKRIGQSGPQSCQNLGVYAHGQHLCENARAHNVTTSSQRIVPWSSIGIVLQANHVAVCSINCLVTFARDAAAHYALPVAQADSDEEGALTKEEDWVVSNTLGIWVVKAKRFSDAKHTAASIC